MEININKDWSIGDLIDRQRKQILRVNHEYQRGLRWTDTQKRMFIDSIFRGYSIPAFYFHKNVISAGTVTNTHFDIVDGQQRIDAIYSFAEGAFPLIDPSKNSGFRFPNFVKDEECPWGGKRFKELSQDLQDELKSHKVVVYEITTENDNSIRDLFIRLQGGTPLTPQDKRDSWPGNFTEYVLTLGGKKGVDKWYGHSLFKELLKTSNESRRRQLLAQVFMLLWTVKSDMKFCDTKSANIDEFYHAHVGFDDSCADAKRFEKICDLLNQILHGKPKIVGHYFIHLFLFVDSLLDEYAHGWEDELAAKLFEFERRVREAARAARERSESEYHRYYTEYGQLTQTQADNADTIRRRHAFFTEEMLNLLSPTKLDSVRSFSELERKTIFFRDRELCQWCRMKDIAHKVLWEDCEIHHVIPHYRGGQTEILNGALVHEGCHPKSSKDVDKFQDWWFAKPMVAPQPNEPDGNARNFPPPAGTVAKFEFSNQYHMGEIKNGMLVLTSGPHKGESCKSFTAASRVVTEGTSRNGWKDWHLKLPDEESWILADDWRSDRKKAVHPAQLSDFLC